jgi:hypothetical protein
MILSAVQHQLLRRTATIGSVAPASVPGLHLSLTKDQPYRRIGRVAATEPLPAQGGIGKLSA